MCDNYKVHTGISKTWRARGILTFSRHGLLLKGVALSIYHDAEFDSTTMCCLCSMFVSTPCIVVDYRGNVHCGGVQGNRKYHCNSIDFIS